VHQALRIEPHPRVLKFGDFLQQLKKGAKIDPKINSKNINSK
jgi:hypothetical protein